MTRIILVLDLVEQGLYVSDDPRPPREIVMAINSGLSWVGAGRPSGDDAPANVSGKGRWPHEATQWAMAHPGVDTVTVLFQPPPVQLTYQQYRVLYALADGRDDNEIAAEFNLPVRSIYRDVLKLKQRFGVETRLDLLKKAVELGMVEAKE